MIIEKYDKEFVEFPTILDAGWEDKIDRSWSSINDWSEYIQKQIPKFNKLSIKMQDALLKLPDKEMVKIIANNMNVLIDSYNKIQLKELDADFLVQFVSDEPKYIEVKYTTSGAISTKQVPNIARMKELFSETTVISNPIITAKYINKKDLNTKITVIINSLLDTKISKIEFTFNNEKVILNKSDDNIYNIRFDDAVVGDKIILKVLGIDEYGNKSNELSKELIYVASNPPILKAISDFDLYNDTSKDIEFIATDSDGTIQQIEFINKPNNITITKKSNLIYTFRASNYTQNEIINLIAKAKDDDNIYSNEISFKINVINSTLDKLDPFNIGGVVSKYKLAINLEDIRGSSIGKDLTNVYSGVSPKFKDNALILDYMQGNTCLYMPSGVKSFGVKIYMPKSTDTNSKLVGMTLVSSSKVGITLKYWGSKAYLRGGCKLKLVIDGSIRTITGPVNKTGDLYTSLPKDKWIYAYVELNELSASKYGLFGYPTYNYYNSSYGYVSYDFFGSRKHLTLFNKNLTDEQILKLAGEK